MSILDKLAAHARERVLADSENMSLDILQAMCREKGRANGARFYDALKKDDLSFICEVKKASPSKGVIARDFPYLDIARDYEAAGADCISCLTEPKWFLGSDDIFREIRAAVSTPMLRKDFTVSDYQLYQSRLMGADCVLLICALLDTKTLAQYLAVCDELGLSALVEAHDADEIRSAVAAGAKIIGVNNYRLCCTSQPNDILSNACVISQFSLLALSASSKERSSIALNCSFVKSNVGTIARSPKHVIYSRSLISIIP